MKKLWDVSLGWLVNVTNASLTDDPVSETRNTTIGRDPSREKDSLKLIKFFSYFLRSFQIYVTLRRRRYWMALGWLVGELGCRTSVVIFFSETAILAIKYRSGVLPELSLTLISAPLFKRCSTVREGNQYSRLLLNRGADGMEWYKGLNHSGACWLWYLTVLPKHEIAHTRLCRRLPARRYHRVPCDVLYSFPNRRAKGWVGR